MEVFERVIERLDGDLGLCRNGREIWNCVWVGIFKRLGCFREVAFGRL